MPLLLPGGGGGLIRTGQSPVLDVVGGAALAFGLAKMRGGYTGKCIRVRRSSDDSEQDIGFTSDGRMDVSALMLHVGSSDGYVTTWYDQSGNGNNATQTTKANQPRIVSGGVVDTAGNKPGLYFNGTSYYFNLPNIIANCPGVTLLSTVRCNTVTGTQCIAYASKGSSAGLDRFSFGPRNNFTEGGWLARVDGDVSSTWIQVNGGEVLIGESALMMGWWDATNGVAKIFRNKIEKYSASVGTSGTITSTPSLTTRLGMTNSSSDGAKYLNGTMYNCIVYLRALSEAERRLASDGILRTYGALKIVVLRGNSILDTSIGSPAEADRMHSQLKANFADPSLIDVINRAYNGATISQMQSLDEAGYLTYN